MGGGQSSTGNKGKNGNREKLHGFVGIKETKSNERSGSKSESTKPKKAKPDRKIDNPTKELKKKDFTSTAPNSQRGSVTSSTPSSKHSRHDKVSTKPVIPTPPFIPPPVPVPEKPATFRVLMKQVLELAKEQRSRVGKFKKDEKHNAMELYEVMGLENDDFFSQPSELQLALRAYTFPPLMMSNLKNVDVLDKRTFEEILGKAEAKRRAEEESLDLQELPKTSAAVLRDKLRRQAVSSEVTQPITFSQTQHAKKPADLLERIQKLFLENILFKSLDSRDRNVLFDALEQEDFSPGDVIIEQGEDGDSYYVVDSGRCQITIKEDGDDDCKEVGFIGTGDGFGELGLMYGTYRAATITAVTDVTCWVLDRDSYRGILLNTTMKKRERYMEFLDKIPILKSVEPYEKARIADVLEPLEVKTGDEIMKEGTEGEYFYFIESGEVSVSTIADGEICMLKTGEYFGELALLFRQPRKASVYAVTNCYLVSLSRKNFQNYLGPVESILKRNTQNYDEYLNPNNNSQHL